VLGVGALLSVAGVLVCLVAPLYSSSGDGSTDGSATLLEVNGPGALVPLGLFLVLAVGAWLVPWRPGRVLLVAGHAGLTLLAMLTIGVFFLPATVVLGVGLLREGRAARVPPAAPRVAGPRAA
jgi:hypothetical protein